MKILFVTLFLVFFIFSSFVFGFSDSDKEAILGAHNTPRAEAGITHGPKPISPLNNLTWDDSIESFVQSFVDQCVFKNPPTGKYGYTLFRVENSEFQPGEVIERAFDNSKDLYDWSTLRCINDSCCYMYPTIIANISTSIGCATKWCGSYNFFVCAYNPDGGLVGVPPYTKAPNAVVSSSLKSTRSVSVSSASSGSLDINWRDNGFITPIKNQGNCGGCWAFAACSVLESNFLISQGTTDAEIDLSEQHFINCIDDGCTGGSAYDALSQMINTGVLYEFEDPFVGATMTCPQVTSQNATFKWSSYPIVNPSDFITNLQTGPLYVAVFVDEGFQNYVDGIYECSKSVTPNSGLNHQLTLIGYNSAENYFLLKNSWGTGWGLNGYMKITPGTCNMYEAYGGLAGF